ncbi:TetR family transcriptional regulator [Acinetobacter baumannii]|nr:TetR family transcriptional regulator [Acinetobacter baumannii]EKT8141418.1 TetR family transcriptional regulator [Acinetobacter baumannii]EKU7083959.1 TetR family transcriptional regulator [Acinetobacter baumannii]EKV1039796.1 TetR family transcriptional regulator [Acinetobacter baumannii]EKV1043523.1 TetR family transcriptional regulator [Acinetobacter baumannii]EKV1918641.1 TetR family transcriptional regulator [Acinetobacter baumannii]
MNLEPPYNHPMYVNGQMTMPWRTYFDQITKLLIKLNEASNEP